MPNTVLSALSALSHLIPRTVFEVTIIITPTFIDEDTEV